MKNKVCFIIIILLLTISFLAWSSASFEITPDIDTLVPEDALMYFQISNPEKLMNSMDSFLAATGMNEFIGNMPLQDFFGMLLVSKEANLSLKYLDLSKPTGFAILPSTKKYTEEDDIDFMLFIPINTSMNILDLIQNKPEGDDFWYVIFMNYLVYFSSEDLKNSFPPKSVTGLPHMEKYSDDSFSIYLDIAVLMESFGIDTSELVKELKYQDSSGSDLVTRTIEGYFHLFSQLEILYSNILLNKKGITFQSDLFFSDKMENIKEWGKHLQRNGWVSLAPDNTNLIWNFSISQMIKSMGEVPGLEDFPILYDIPFIVSGFSNFEEKMIHSSTNIPPKDIMSIFRMIMERL